MYQCRIRTLFRKRLVSGELYSFHSMFTKTEIFAFFQNGVGIKNFHPGKNMHHFKVSNPYSEKCMIFRISTLHMQGLHLSVQG